MMIACASCGSTRDDGIPNDLATLPAGHEQRGGDVTVVGKELLSLIAEHIERAPRSLQKAIGPSELGTPCKRKIAYKLLGLPEVNTQKDPAWFPTIGTAVHSWLEDCLTAHNDAHTTDRFYLEQRVTVGQVGGVDISGSCDCYDRVTATVVDWKIVGDTKLEEYRRKGPGEQYRRQAHLYGRGYQLAGLPVDHVAVMFLPRNKSLGKAHFWTEPYSEQVAVETLEAADAIHSLISAGGVHALPLIPTTQDYCNYCPFKSAGSTDLATGCPGDAAYAATAQPPATLADALN